MQLIIKNLYKTYANGIEALKNVNLTIYQGMFGLLGPNGAGKSTLMRTLATLQEPDSGSIMLDDINVLNQKEEIRKMLGYLPQEFGVYPKIEAEVLLNHLAVLKGVANKGERRDLVHALLHKTNLWTARKKYLGTFSGGMKQRFGIAQALLANPRLIIVDEPTAGLDPAERNRFLNLLSEIGENAIIVLSTHIVDDVKELCKHMAIIHNGEMLYQGMTSDAISLLEGKIWKKQINKSELTFYKENFMVISERLLEGMPVVHVFSETMTDDSFEQIPVELEDVYFTKIMTHSTNGIDNQQSN